MREIRLFVDTPLRVGLELALPATAAQHAVRVLRLRAGDAVTLFNGDGHQYPAQLSTIAPGVTRARVATVESPARESPLRVTLLQALARGEKMDWIVQKATELGVARVAPIVTARSEVKLDAARAAKRLEHWRAIAIGACEQCGRNTVPRIDVAGSLEAFLAANAATDARFVLQPGDATRIRSLTPPPTPVTLAVGPEGGFGEDDLAALRAAGYGALSLGPRILRTETAGIAALAALQAMLGDF
ncbi:MAG: 16S rRNA (uracil(1498)-N(3))-methyltransferase [Rhodanobacteraceae bacterium]|nr:MAG: 16S rRNA (uracil(1498)-N(3))-methyltransferase [Rhodanobacteraceae bacterium]